jgi:protein-tyrosine phosphatase
LGQETRICFVCLGNIVRSPLAENLFRKTVEDKGSAESYQVESAGTGDWHVGEPPDPRMRRVAARHGLIYSGLARQFQAADFDRFDWVVAMDLENRDNLRRLARTEAQRAKIRLLREFDPRGGPKSSVPDPYYGGVEGFEEVYRIVERSVRGLLQALENGEME